MRTSPKEHERINMVRQLWQERYKEAERTGWNVMGFHRWLELNRSELLNRKHGDSYQQLKSDLRGLWRD